MRILIVEDEPPIAAYIHRLTEELLRGRNPELDVVHTIGEAIRYLGRQKVDLCLLDLNLSGADGFELLERIMVLPLQCIIISAHCDQAVRAFEYGVIDFIPKPFGTERLRLALNRYFSRGMKNSLTRQLVYRIGNENHLLKLEDIEYLKACRIFVEAYTVEGRRILLEKHLNQLERILPENFFRIHRSYMVNLKEVGHYQTLGQNRHRLKMNGGRLLPISRQRFPRLVERLKG